MPTRQTVVKPLGLMTRPNEYGAYPPGAMAVADNLLFRDVGEMQVSKDVASTQTIGAFGDVIRKLFAMDSGIIWSAARDNADAWTLRFGASSAPLPYPGNTGIFSDTGFISPLRMRDHFLVNSTIGMLVSDVMAPASAADRTFRAAGLPQPQIGSFTTSGAGGAVAANTTVGYCVLFKRSFANGYDVVSTPSLVMRYVNSTGAAVNPQLQILWDPLTGILAGDTIEVYRTDAVAAVLATTDPGTTCKLVLSHIVTAAEALGGSSTLTDTQAPGPLGVTYGRELYTNPGQQGALAANRQPNISKLTASYKGYAFYANVTERPIWTFQVPGGMSNSSPGLSSDYERTYGIGVRTITATSVLGNPTVTGVSASHMLGIAVGQMLVSGSGGSFPAATVTVQSFNTGAGTITFTGNATAGVAGATLVLADRFQIDGGGIQTITGLGSVVNQLAQLKAYEVTCDQTIAATTAGGTLAASGFTLSVEPIRPWYASTITIRATNGANYQPAIPDIGSTAQTFTRTPRPNMLQWSHSQQPEHAPPSNTAFVGAGTIVGLQSTRDALWIFCTDGLFRLSGDSGQWRIDQLDTTLVLSAPQCCTALRDSVYAYTNRGVVRIADDGFDELSEVAIGDTLVGTAYYETAALIVERDEANDEIHVIDTGVSGGTPTLYLYSTRAQAWSKLTFTTVTALAYQRIPTNPATQANGWLVIGQSPGPGVSPRYSLFDQTATNTLTATGQYQPFYADDPMQLKQWIDATWIFGLADAGRTVASSWLGVADGSNTLTAQLNGDSRATYGIPRSAAVAPTISPGFSIAAGAFAGPVCKGVSLRYQSLTEQQAYR